MNTPVNLSKNYDQLKHGLDRLGFNSPDLDNSIRNGLVGGQPRFSAYFGQNDACTCLNVCFKISLNEKETHFVIGYYYAAFIHNHLGEGRVLKDINCQFAPEVSQSKAIQVLATGLNSGNSDPEDFYRGFTKEGVKKYLAEHNPENIDYFHQLNHTNMNQNVEFLKNSLLNLGFGDKLNAEMEKQITAKSPEFNLAARQEYNQHKMDYTLHFKAGNNQDMYFLNKFDATLKNGKEDTKQSFYINKGNGITAKEAFNLMDKSDGLDGRAVFKQLYNQEKEKYHAWVKLDWKDLTDGGNARLKQHTFDVEKFLDGNGIKEMNDPKTKEDLVRSLKKGNKQQITVEKDGSERKYFISANPQYKTVNLFDHQMKKMKREELFPTEQKQNKDQKQTTQQKEELPQKKQNKSRKITAG